MAYVVATLKVIADPSDDVNQEEFLKVVLPPSLLDLLRTKVEQGSDGGGYCGSVGTMALVPQVVDAVKPVPVGSSKRANISASS